MLLLAGSGGTLCPLLSSIEISEKLDEGVFVFTEQGAKEAEEHLFIIHTNASSPFLGQTTGNTMGSGPWEGGLQA